MGMVSKTEGVALDHQNLGVEPGVSKQDHLDSLQERLEAADIQNQTQKVVLHHRRSHPLLLEKTPDKSPPSKAQESRRFFSSYLRIIR